MPDPGAGAAELRFVIHNELDIIMWMMMSAAKTNQPNASGITSRTCIIGRGESRRHRFFFRLWTQFFSNSIREKEKGGETSRAIGGAGPAFL